MPVVFLVLSFIFVLSSFAHASSSETIRIALSENNSMVRIESTVGLRCEQLASAPGSKKMIITASAMKSGIERCRSKDAFTRINGKKYRGWIELRKQHNGRILVINELDLEDYLKGVITSELPQDWEMEAMKAQAVAARTYALYQKRMSGKKMFHMMANVNSQVYNGGSGERLRGVRAVDATRGQVITYHGRIIPAFYHACCGGHTENATELWGIDEPYLKGVDCECQSIVKDGIWEKRISTARLTDALRKQGIGISSINDLALGDITPAGRVKDVVIKSIDGSRIVPAEMVRSAIGTSFLPSVFFELELDGTEAVFSGRGSGHGVGLCQWGAKEMAGEGYDYRAIIAHYYPGTALIRLE